MTTRQHNGCGSVRRRGNVFWIRYYHRGRRIEESSHSGKRRDAEQLLKGRIAEIQSGRFVGRNAERVTFEELADLLVEDYTVNGRRSLDRAQRSLKHLRAVFGFDFALQITNDRLHRYMRHRLEEGTARSTIRNEFAALKRAFRLAVQRGRLHVVPAFPTLTVRNAREEFFEEWELAALMAELPANLKGMIEFTYLTGWRMNSEVRGLTWDQVDFDAAVVRLKIGTTKNNEARIFPLDVMPQLGWVLERQRADTDECEQTTGKLIPWVFHREGREIRSFYTAWRSACKRAGVFGSDGRWKIPHDLRRTAVRNLERAGVPRSVAMQLVGHKTENVYRRYAIVAEADLREGVAKLVGVLGGEWGQNGDNRRNLMSEAVPNR